MTKCEATAWYVRQQVYTLYCPLPLFRNGEYPKRMYHLHFCKNVHPERPENVRPPFESGYNRSLFWVFKVATYLLVNSNERWQSESAHLLLSPGISRETVVPQLLYRNHDRCLLLMVASSRWHTSDVENDIEESFIDEFNPNLKLCTIKHGTFFALPTRYCYICKSPSWLRSTLDSSKPAFLQSYSH